MKWTSVVGQLGPLHTDIIQVGKEYFQEIKEEALSTSRQIWEAFGKNVRNKEPFGFINFKDASTFLHKYKNMVLSMGPDWVGCRYRSTIIWYPLGGCHNVYNLPYHQVNQVFAVLKQKNDFRLYKEEVYPAYSLIQLHVNHLIAWGHAKRSAGEYVGLRKMYVFSS